MDYLVFGVGFGSTLVLLGWVLAVVVTSAALQPLDAAEAVRTFLPTQHWLAWIDLFRDPPLLDAVRTGVEVQLGWIVVAFGAAWANFTTKDVTS